MSFTRSLLILTALASGVWAQLPDGKEIATAIPIVIGQTVEDAGSANLNPIRVYKITVARGQRLAFTMRPTGTANVCAALGMLNPTARSVEREYDRNQLFYESGCQGTTPRVVRTTVPESGTYFVFVWFYNATAGPFTLRVDAEGTPIAVPNPTRAGCLNGKVDSITYSLQWIAVGIPDELTISGTRACATCQVKPPLQPEMAARFDAALANGVNVEACYDSAGNIFQLKTSR